MCCRVFESFMFSHEMVGDGKFYKMGVVGKDVDVLITLEMIRDK